MVPGRRPDGLTVATLIECVGLRKVYAGPTGPLETLRNLTFSIAPGELISIIGPSGCGKSTLLRILCGLTPPSAGEVRIEGRTPDEARAARRFGFVFQEPVLLPWRRADANVRLPLDVLRTDRRQARAIPRHLLRLVGLGGFEANLPRQLSGGMQQRVAIARALSFDPAILLMDEPFGALDAITRDAMNVELLRVWKEMEKTIVFVTHSLSEAVFLSHRVFVMSSRPGEIKRTLVVDLPFPRDRTTRRDPRFHELSNELLQELE
jgi:NitT/TauT family transport system ATP-binding protein